MAMPSYTEKPQAYGMPPKPNYHKGRRNYVEPSDKGVLLPFYDSTLIKPLKKIKGLEFKPADISEQALPELMYINPKTEKMYVDHNYQRELTNSNFNLLIHILEHFDWKKLQVPNAFISEKGNIYFTDGQTTALACLHHPQIDKMPISAVKVSDAAFAAIGAEAFLSLNTVKIAVPRADRLTAQIAMRDPLAMHIADVFRKYGIKVIRIKRNDEQCAARETMVVGKFEEILKRDGEEFFDRLCSILAAANYSPIRAIHIQAVRRLLLDESEKLPYSLDRLKDAIRSKVDKYALLDAEIEARRFKTTKPDALAKFYKEAYKKGAVALS